MEYESCEFCKFEKCNSEEYPCRICKHAYDNMFVKKNSKTRQSEFLRHYPNANIEEVMEILPCTIDKYLFVELIMPPLFPKKSTLTEQQIDEIVGGKILTRYKHLVRGYRKIYGCDTTDTNI